MKNRKVNSLISWVLIVSPLWWTSGCYTFREFTDLRDAQPDELCVATKGGNSYTFTLWEIDGSGNVSGTGTMPSHRKISHTRAVGISGGVPRDSIASWHYHEKIRLTTKGMNIYELTEWSSDSTGQVIAQGTSTKPQFVRSRNNDGMSPQSSNTEIRLPADSVKSYAKAELSMARTGLFTAGAILVVASLWFWAAFGNWQDNAFSGTMARGNAK